VSEPNLAEGPRVAFRFECMHVIVPGSTGYNAFSVNGLLGILNPACAALAATLGCGGVIASRYWLLVVAERLFRCEKRGHSSMSPFSP
jgi:hypothetical protein